VSQNDIRHDVVRKTLALLPAEFRTKDLSEHPAMIGGHPSASSERNYHAWVGAFLSQLCSDVSNISRTKHPRGAKWRNHLHGRAAASASEAGGAVVPARDTALVGTARDAADDLGPQYGGDNAFTARMRLHQSWYRARVLGVPCGTGPQPASPNRYGNMLRRADAERGLNFVDPEIHQVALARVRERTGTVEPFRLMHNMLSSQPMCFNLFGLFVHRRELATKLLRAVPELELSEVISVQLEYAPEPSHDYLNDRTAFDAFIDYRRLDGSRALLGIETKLTEPFSQKHYDSPVYRRWMTSPRSPWTDTGALQVSDIRHNQLWRDHLLAVAMRDREGSPYAHATLMLVRHPQDHDCARTVEGYRALLEPGDGSFFDMPLDRLLEAWRGALGPGEHARWLDALQTRYVDLSASEGARP